MKVERAYFMKGLFYEGLFYAGKNGLFYRRKKDLFCPIPYDIWY